MTISQYDTLLPSILNAPDITSKNKILDQNTLVKSYLQCPSFIQNFIINLPPNQSYLMKSIIAVGQSNRVFNVLNKEEDFTPKLMAMVETLEKVEAFYKSIGGIIGYHHSALTILHEVESESAKTKYFKPPMFNIRKDTQKRRFWTRKGIESIALVGDMYPIGGAGDRLQLEDPITKTPLPAAMLNFQGRSLLTGLIRDVQAREFLHYKLFGKQVITPIAMMTSHEKDNHRYITEICKNQNWYGRPPESFQFFTQPLVPVVSTSGDWIMKDILEMRLKPGGHGVIWQCALNDGVLEWFKNCGKKKVLLRQINNPIAGMDHGILTNTGICIDKDKDFGVASCERIVNMPEGMNVLCYEKGVDGYHYGIRNIEYTEFKKRGIEDKADIKKSRRRAQYSKFPSNTNILFVDITAAERSVNKDPIPGRILNMKSQFKHINANGKPETSYGGRLESTMQNIADLMHDTFSQKQLHKRNLELNTFLSYNKRTKTISTTKQLYNGNLNIDGTPLGAYYDLLKNHRTLLHNHCLIMTPKMPSKKSFALKHPPFNIQLHPAIGPCWSIIEQKICLGKLAENCELILDIAEVNLESIDINGSLIVEATDPLGITDENGILTYGDDCGKCSLINVKVSNEGIDWTAENTYWKNEIQRRESLHITIHGNGEFYAKDITITGNHHIVVPDGIKMTMLTVDGELTFVKEKIDSPSWKWHYEFDSEDRIVLKR
ncbi:MAG: UTP--glucose-1-phosphate uridylyltransferase [Chlamydiota bacterium]|nr:UTP--glucose-1-phosphate uridylyltransferase [Chlamydiota bacterium]